MQQQRRRLALAAGQEWLLTLPLHSCKLLFNNSLAGMWPSATVDSR
jgi:hypothetical protein